jgi:hypothetical protein
MKKIVIAALVLITLFLFYLTDFADAHGRQGYYGGGRYSAWHGGWYGRGWYPGVHGGLGGGLYSGYVMAPRVYGPFPYPYYRTNSGRWERRWDPYRQTNINLYVPSPRIRYP